MPCRVDICDRCNDYYCKCGKPEFEARVRTRQKVGAFDWEDSLCDVLALLEKKYPAFLTLVDPLAIKAWRTHQESEKIAKATVHNKMTASAKRTVK